MRDRLLLLSLIALAAVLAAGCNRPPDTAAASTTLVRAEQVRGETVRRTVTLVGTVLPFRVSQVAASTPGKVVECPVREGTVVGHDATLARLRTETLDIEIKAAEQLRDEKQQRWKEMEKGFREEEKLKSAARKLAAEAAVKFAEAKEARLKDLFAQRKVTREELDEVVSTAEQARQILAEAAADLEEKNAGNTPEQVAQAKAAYEAQVQALALLNDQRTKHAITAPFPGVVVKLHTEEGQWLAEGGPVATLIDLEQVEVVVNVEGGHVDLVRLGATVMVAVPELESQLEGEVVYFVPRADHLTGSRGFPVRVRIKNEVHNGVPLLKEGMLAQVTLAGESHDALLVPKDAIVRSSGKPVVFKLDAAKKARPVTVTEGVSRGDYVEVSATELAESDLVVTEGAERLRPLQEVKVMEERGEVNEPVGG